MRTTLSCTLILTATTLASGARAQDAVARRNVAALDSTTVTRPQSAEVDILLPVPSEIPAPRGAFEVGVEGGYTQPLGEIGDGRSFRNVAEAGGAVGLSLGLRINPHWALAFTTQFHNNKGDDNLGRNAEVRGLSSGVKATYHIRPYRTVDPYLSLGTGYRVMWLVPDGAPNELVHGFQLGRALVGLDFRVSKDVSIGPMIGADFNMFLWDNPQGAAVGDQKIGSVRPSTFLFGGIGATFDVAGQRVVEHRIVEAPAQPGAAIQPLAVTAPPARPITVAPVDPSLQGRASIIARMISFQSDRTSQGCPVV